MSTSTATKPNVDDFTVPEKILLAADTLDKEGQSPFSAEALIVTSWQKFPKTFGLKGYVEQYPGRYLTFRGGELLWDAADMAETQRLEKERIHDWKEAPQLTIRAVPAAQEPERLEVYATGG